ncbi:hypothetical protein GQ53DRAFT_33184 [Thozetella sp. PMI_491]|nr:hypothetical protein GQ53DRAFT_33184 [Thozetella sp. PMI_491]
MQDAEREQTTVRKTCEICFRAKIRCDRTRASGPCDRCLRLHKTCVFIPSKKRIAPVSHARRIEQMEAKIDRILTNRPSTRSTARASQPRAGTPILEDDSATSICVEPTELAASPPPNRAWPNKFDPVLADMLSEDEADDLLNVFRTTMASHFPFVMLPEDTTSEEVRFHHPSLWLSALAVASFRHPQRQQALGTLFTEMVSARLVAGNLADLDLLQGLLVHLAWAQYQPRPRRYSQFLHIAISLVSDMRLDRPRHQKLWMIDKSNPRADIEDRGVEEIRALIGTYYLASSSSIVLQKLRSFSYSPFMLRSSEELAAQNISATDKYLPYIVQVQRLSEKASDFASMDVDGSPGGLLRGVEALRAELDLLKSTVAFPLSECPTLLLQMNTLALQISQLCLPGFPFAAAGLQDSGLQLLHWLSDSIYAAKSLVDTFLNISIRGEYTITNMEWIMCSCGLALAVRLDILAADPRMSSSTEHLRRFLDLRHVLKQVLLRLESAVLLLGESSREDDPMGQMLQRAKLVEAWYLRQTRTTSLSTPSYTPKENFDAVDLTHGLHLPSVSKPSSAELPLESADPNIQPEFEFSIMDIFDDMDMQGINFGPSSFMGGFGSFE